MVRYGMPKVLLLWSSLDSVEAIDSFSARDGGSIGVAGAKVAVPFLRRLATHTGHANCAATVRDVWMNRIRESSTSCFDSGFELLLSVFPDIFSVGGN